MALKLDNKPGHQYDSDENGGNSWRPPGFDKDNSGYDSDNPSSKATKSPSEMEANPSINDGQSSATSSKEGGFYRPSTSGKKDKSKTAKLKGRFTRKQKGVAGGIGVLLGSGMLGFFMLIPQADFIKLDFALGRSSAASRLATETRIYGFTRQARAFNTGDIGETRVGFIGSRIFGDITSRLESKHGLKFERDPRTGRPSSLGVDPPSDSPLRGATPEETRTNILRELDLPDDTRLTQTGSSAKGPSYGVNLEGESIKNVNRLSKSVVNFDNLTANKTRGSIVTAIRNRQFKKFWNAPSLFNPINRAAASIDQRISLRLDAARKNRTGKVATLSTKYQQKLNLARAKLGGKATAASGVLTFTGGLCLLKETADLLPALNYASIVLPAMEEAIDKQAVASQVRYGENFDTAQLGIIKETFKDDQGKNIWGGKALNASANGNAGEGTEAKPALSAAFNMRGSNIDDLVDFLAKSSGDNALIEGVTGIGDTGAALACNPIGYGVQIGLSVGLLLLGPPGAAAKTAQVAQGLAITALITNLLSGVVQDRSEEVAREFCGQDEEGVTVDAEAYGNCLAYAARAGHNMNAASMGGVELSDTQERVTMMELEKKELEEFREKSFFARMFDMKEPRSLAVNTIHGANQSQIQDVAKLAPKIFTGSTSIISDLSSSFTGSANAQASSYDWGENFKLVSIPLEILEDPKYDDPYENAAIATEIFSNGNNEIERAKKCFGVEIKPDPLTGRWQSTATEEVVPMEDEYVGANCDDLSEEKWIRTVLFVFDDSIVTSIDCYEGGEDSCQETGFGQLTAAPTAGTATTGLTAPGLNGYAVPCQGDPRTVVRTGPSNGPYAVWDGIPTSGVIGQDSSGKDINVYIREACPGATDVKTIFIASSIHGSENGGQFVSHELLYNADIPDNIRIIAVPEINTSGISRTSRTNSNGVDLNRNNSVNWGPDPLGRPSRYEGPSPASEPETQALNNFILSLGEVDLALHYHDDISWVAAVGSTPVSYADTYANYTPDTPLRDDEQGKVYQGGSLDLWQNETTGAKTLLVELSSLQDTQTINGHVNAVKALAEML